LSEKRPHIGYPIEEAGDVVLDPFVGTGTTMLAAAKWGRNSIGVEIDPEFVRLAWEKLRRETASLVGRAKLELLV